MKQVTQNFASTYYMSWGIAILFIGFGVGLPMIFPILKNFEHLFWYVGGIFVGRAIMISEFEATK